MNTNSDTGIKTPLMVFGDDGSASADVACLWVANHRWEGWDLEVITATMPSLPLPDTQAEYREWNSPHARTILGAAGFHQLRHLAIERDPRLVFDARTEASLIVVGDRNEKRPAPSFLGSTAEWLVHHPPAPLAIIRSARPVRSVLVCVDGSGHAQTALRAFIALPFSRDADVTVMHVDEGIGHRRAVDDAVDMLTAAGITPRLRSDSGRPAACIAEELRREPRDLTVLGTRGLTGLSRLLLGSTANAVVRSGHGTVLVASDHPIVTDNATSTA